MSSSGMENYPSASSDVDFDDYGEFGYQLEPEYTETSYISFLRYKRHRGRAPDVLTNRQSRLVAYRQFVCWVRKGQPLGKKYSGPTSLRCQNYKGRISVTRWKL